MEIFKSNNIEDSYNQAREFCKDFKCEIIEENYTSEDLSKRYISKIKKLDGQIITRIRIVNIDHLTGIYISTASTKNYKEQLKICFGGKTIKHEESYKTAINFIKLLNITEQCKIEDLVKSATGDCL